MKRVQAGEAIQITCRGRVIARLEAEHDPAQAARQWLKDLQGMSPIGSRPQPGGSADPDRRNGLAARFAADHR